MQTKIELRQQFKHLRNHLVESSPHAIFQKLITLPQINSASIICTFISTGHEVDTHEFIEWALAHHKRICVPKVIGDDIQLKQITALSQCKPGVLGILEPPETAVSIKPQAVDVYIVPGLAFDMNGYRLGYGKGYYDRLLKDVHSFTIGIGYTVQLVYELPHSSTDIPLTALLTDRLFIQITNTK